MLSSYEGQRRLPALSTLDQILEALGVDLLALHAAIEYLKIEEEVLANDDPHNAIAIEK